MKVIGLLGMVCGAALGAPAELKFYVSPTMTPVPPQGVTAQAADSAKVVGARGERETFIIVLKGVAPEAKLSVHPLPLLGAGTAIDPDEITVRRLAFVPAEEVGLIADALLPLNAKVKPPLRTAENTPLLVEIRIPRGARSDLYRGALEVAADEAQALVPLDVRVVPLRLPAQPKLPVVLDFDEKAVLFGSTPGTEPVPLRHAFASSALTGRMALLGLGGTPGYSMVPGGGSIQLDFDRYDKAVAPFLEGEARLSAVSLPTPGGLNDVNRIKYALSFRSHLKDRNWQPTVVGATPFGTWEECAEASESTWWRLRRDDLKLGGDPAAVRAIGWLAFQAGAAGLRYSDAFDGFRTGTFSTDALYYPSVAMGEGAPLVVESLRLVLLREGLEDYELLQQGGVAAKTWAESLTPSPARYPRLADPYDASKRALARVRRSSGGGATGATR